MKYKRSDIILCYPGVGRTFFTSFKDDDKEIKNSAFTYNADYTYEPSQPKFEGAPTFINSAIALRETRNYRYILLPLLPEFNSILSDKGIPYLIVAPHTDERNEWVKRWLKAGASATEIYNRTCNWSDFMRLDVSKGKGIRVWLDKSEWLGNVLEQSPTTTEEGNE